MIPHARETSGPSWKMPSYWIPPLNEELNVWYTFEERYEKVKRGKTKSDDNPIVLEYREAEKFDDFKKKSNIWFVCDDALVALRKIPDNSVDYVFTDPSYGESIQYGELCYLWASWLGYGDEYLEKMKREEVVINDEGQNKGFDDYYNLLYVIFKEVGRVVKPNKYMTVTFHNPSFEIRNALERAAYIAGFDLEAVIYEPPATVPSKKSSLQPYGSVSGDFYFRFKNVKKADRILKEDEATFERVILDATKRILIERGEPTPMPIISNGIEPALSEHGFPFSKEKTVEEVIIEHIGTEFVVYDKTGKGLTNQVEFRIK
jgi:DNA modification methylase